jgi:hypothetical protein
VIPHDADQHSAARTGHRRGRTIALGAPALTAASATALIVTALIVTGAAMAAGPAAAGAVTPPPERAVFDYQIMKGNQPKADAGIVDRDHTEAPARGVDNICYINAFQTQPTQDGQWPAQTILTQNGRRVADPGWPGEFLLDTRTAASRAGHGHPRQRCRHPGPSAVGTRPLTAR